MNYECAQTRNGDILWEHCEKTFHKWEGSCNMNSSSAVVWKIKKKMQHGHVLLVKY